MLFDRLKGVLPETAGEGTHFLVPWLQKAVIFDIRTRPRSISSVTGTKGAARRRPPRCAHRARRSSHETAAPAARGCADAGCAAHAGCPACLLQCPRDLVLATRCADAATTLADLQQVNLTLRVLSRPEVAQLPRIYSVRRRARDTRLARLALTRPPPRAATG